MTKRYQRCGTTVCAVDGVSLAVEPGELLLLMGPSGSGKSTLLQIAASLLYPDQGKVYLGDVETTAPGVESLIAL